MGRVGVVGGMLAVASMAMGCSPCPKGTCTVDLGEFQIAKPRGYKGGPAVVYLHGAGGSAEESIDDDTITQAFLDAGAMVAAPVMQGQTWTIQSTTFGGRDEMAFHDQIRAELGDRFDADTFFVAGFSLGASVSWDLGCLRSADYDGIYSMSGHFWLPLPGCEGAAVSHTHWHGTEDNTFPIEGEEYFGNLQGHLFDAWDVLVDRGSCTSTPSAREGCQSWVCEGGAELERCLDDYPHRRPQGWADDAVQAFGL